MGGPDQAQLRHDRQQPLTLAVTIGSPVAVIAMLAILFEPGGFDADVADRATGGMVAFWIAFAAFFFGLTFGLLQIVTEFADPAPRTVRRPQPRFLPRSPSSPCSSPPSSRSSRSMIAVLTVLHRLPTMSAGATAELVVTLLLDAVAATSLGLLASAAVADPAQATLALPMLCFPAVLFSGAVVPIGTMTAAGRGDQHRHPQPVGVRSGEPSTGRTRLVGRRLGHPRRLRRGVRPCRHHAAAASNGLGVACRPVGPARGVALLRREVESHDRAFRRAAGDLDEAGRGVRRGVADARRARRDRSVEWARLDRRRSR